MKLVVHLRHLTAASTLSRAVIPTDRIVSIVAKQNTTKISLDNGTTYTVPHADMTQIFGSVSRVDPEDDVQEPSLYLHMS